ncbi:MULTISPECIES: DUF3368 domain-containing protein [unclassified Imperialibacter]|uniref:DUF3368 domain-containing protein n=1 Tax=unclassified Imperialibacter TaxID=2629706 RepID=UPI0012549BF4|nr:MULTISPECIES: DUF3368 domain-containing protein [unclassified Imperialibacter]CAD5264568.1 conserved hypothetical protein [Imperialibacter sp. 89]CAD5269476.1 conserved hypothetical protein [Imperialibacter sp. 75]VVT09097.1 conserved hypothetical protein [Imperialibacter sp. EC-SDR9]
MKNGLVIADSGPIFSLALANKLHVLDALFDDVKIPQAVWAEICLDKTTSFYSRIYDYFKARVQKVKGFNELTVVMDFGESEAVMLYKELEADFLLLDDKKARNIAENFGMKCVGTIGILSLAKDKGLIEELRPIFETFLLNKRYYSIELLNTVLIQKGENSLDGI